MCCRSGVTLRVAVPGQRLSLAQRWCWQSLQQAASSGDWFLAAGTQGTIACVAEILFSSLEKSTIILIITIILITNIILIINFFWCILIYFYFFFSLGQVTCTASQVTASCDVVNPRVGNHSVHRTIYMIFFILAILYWTEFSSSIYDMTFTDLPYV